MTNDVTSTDPVWGVVELFGHVLLAGLVTEVERYGGKMLRLDTPGDGEEFLTTQFIGHAAIYRITVTTEDTARRIATSTRPEPVTRWELQPLASPDRWLEDDADPADDLVLAGHDESPF